MENIKEIKNRAIYYYHEEQNLKKAEELVIEVEKYYLEFINRNDTKAMVELAKFYAQVGKNNKEKYWYLKAIEKNNTEAMIELGINSMGLVSHPISSIDNLEKAQKLFFRALENGDVSAFREIAELYWKKKEYSKAEEYFHIAHKNNVDILFLLKEFYIQTRQYNKAEQWFLENEKKFSTTEKKLYLGDIYKSQKKYSEAEYWYLKVLEEKLKKEEEVGWIFWNLNNLYREWNNLDKFFEICLKLSEKGYEQAMIELGRVYLQQKEYEKAEYWFLKIQENNKSFFKESSATSLVEIYNNLRNLEKVKYWFIKTIESGNGNIVINFMNAHKALFNLMFQDCSEIEEILLNNIKFETLENIKKGYTGLSSSTNAIIFLINQYERNGNLEKAKKLCLKLSKYKYTKGIRTLTDILKKNRKFTEMVELYSESIRKGYKWAINDFGEWYRGYDNKEKSLEYILKEKAYEEAYEVGNMDEIYKIINEEEIVNIRRASNGVVKFIEGIIKVLKKTNDNYEILYKKWREDKYIEISFLIKKVKYGKISEIAAAKKVLKDRFEYSEEEIQFLIKKCK